MDAAHHEPPGARMSPFRGRFDGRTAVVTGAGSGLGREVAARIVEEGGRVVIWDIDPGRLAEAKARVGATEALQVDVSDLASVETAALGSNAALGRIDILVQSAGITGATAAAHEYPVDSWLRTVDINLNGVFYGCRAVIPFMLANGYGRIVNVSSVAGKEGNPNASPIRRRRRR